VKRIEIDSRAMGRARFWRPVFGSVAMMTFTGGGGSTGAWPSHSYRSWEFALRSKGHMMSIWMATAPAPSFGTVPALAGVRK